MLLFAIQQSYCPLNDNLSVSSPGFSGSKLSMFLLMCLKMYVVVRVFSKKLKKVQLLWRPNLRVFTVWVL